MDNSRPSKASGVGMRSIHRIVGTIILLFTLYFGVTGVMIQTVDLRAIATHAAATDPEMMAIRESIDGTPNFSVIAPTDFAAPAMPADYDFNAALKSMLTAARSALGVQVPLKYLELRVLNGQPLGLVQAENRLVRVDLATGKVLPDLPARPRTPRVQAWHQRFKQWHRIGALSDRWEWINGLVGIGLFSMILTGLILYFRLLRTRRGAGLTAIFWSSGGWWRSLHRGVSVVAAAFLVVVSISGTLLAFDTFALGIYGMTHGSAGKYSRFPKGMIGDLSSPLPDDKVEAMLATTLTAFHGEEGAAPIKVLRLRYFSGLPQGLIVAGGQKPNDTRQLVFDASTGKRASMTEPSYPYSGFPFGWKEHELMKQIHRGDVIGIPGRLMDVFAGLSLVFLSASGLYMYLDVLRRRRRGGRTQLFWT